MPRVVVQGLGIRVEDSGSGLGLELDPWHEPLSALGIGTSRCLPEPETPNLS